MTFTKLRKEAVIFDMNDVIWWDMPWYAMLRYNMLWYAMICYDTSARGKIQCTLVPPGSIRPPWGATALRNWASPEDITKYEITKYDITKYEMTQYETILRRVAQHAASLHPGWKWRENEEVEREWGIGERMQKWREIHSLHFLIFSLFPPFLSICYIKNCHILSRMWKKLNIRAMKK